MTPFKNGSCVIGRDPGRSGGSGRWMWTGIAAVLLLVTGCRSLPEVQPFADATATIHHAITASGRTAVAQLADIEGKGSAPTRLGGEPATPLARDFYQAWQKREAMFAALDTYAASLVQLVHSGNHGAESAQALAKSASDLASTVSSSFPGGDPAVQLVTSLASQAYGIIAREVAAQRLDKAIALEDPVIQKIARLIAADLTDLKRLNEVWRNSRRAALADETKPDRQRLNTLLKMRSNLDQDGDGNLSAVDLDKLERVGPLIAHETASPWYLDYVRRRDDVLNELRTADAVLDQAGLALEAWATAHANIGVAVRQKRPPSLAELQQVTADLLTAYQQYRTQTNKGT